MTPELSLLTTSEVAKMLAVNPATIRRWAEEGSIPSITLPGGGQRRFRRQDVDAILRGDGVPAAATP
jgi:excisionase family DNA binding protein